MTTPPNSYPIHQSTPTQSNNLIYPFNLLNLLSSLLIPVLLLNPLHILHNKRILIPKLHPPSRSDKREAQHDIRSGQILATEPRPALRRSLQQILEEIKLREDVARQESLLDLLRYDAGEEFDEERDWGVFDLYKQSVSGQ